MFSLLPILSLLVGFYLTSISKGTLGATLSFYLYVSYFIEPISNLSNARVMLFNAKKKAELVKELETEVEIVQGGTELLDDAGVQAHTFLQLGCNNQALALQLRHFRFDISLAADGQCVGGHIACIASHSETDRSVATLFKASIVERPIPRLGVFIMRKRFMSSSWFAMTRK